jgi:hypothetical protein
MIGTYTRFITTCKYGNINCNRASLIKSVIGTMLAKLTNLLHQVQSTLNFRRLNIKLKIQHIFMFRNITPIHTQLQQSKNFSKTGDNQGR